MTEIDIIQYPDKRLLEKCPTYDFMNYPEDLANAVQMAELMRSFKHCAGLAAPQIGIARRYFVMRDGIGQRFCFDPKIKGHGRDLTWAKEGSMSIKDTLVLVPRWRIIDVEFVNSRSELVKETLKGVTARIFQHEYDYLDGKLIVLTENDR